MTLSGNLNVAGDITYDEANAVNWNISGIATATKLHVGVDTGFYNEDLVVNGNARVTGILTTSTVSASTIKASTAFYPPIYTTTQRDAGSFGEGAIIFNTTSKKMEFYDGTNWQSLPGMTLGLTVALDG